VPRLSIDQIAQPVTKPLTSTREGGHDRAHRNANYIRNLSVREALQLAQYQYLPQTRGQLFDRVSDQLRVRALEQQGFWIAVFAYAMVYFFLELGLELPSAVLLQPTEGRRANNSQQPGARIATSEGAKVSKGPQARLLNDILRIIAVPQEPAREVMSRIKMRKDDVLETANV
jgi:hypothetical protein